MQIGGSLVRACDAGFGCGSDVSAGQLFERLRRRRMFAAAVPNECRMGGG